MPDSAASEAQAVADQMNGSTTQGLLRIVATVAILAVLLLAAIFWRARRRRHDVEMALAEIAATITVDEPAAPGEPDTLAAEPARLESPEPPAK